MSGSRYTSENFVFLLFFFKDSTTCYWAKAIELDKKYLRLQKSSSDKVEEINLQYMQRYKNTVYVDILMIDN